MSLVEKKIPYEFLIRFNNEGRVNGAHIAYTEKIIKEGQEIHSKQTDPQPVTLGVDEGFPLEDILGELNVLNVKEIELLQSEKSELKKTAIDNEKKITSLKSRIEELEGLLQQTKNDLEKSNSHLVEVNKSNEDLIKNIPVTDETV